MGDFPGLGQADKNTLKRPGKNVMLQDLEAYA
jgi:hypothetical protein